MGFGLRSGHSVNQRRCQTGKCTVELVGSRRVSCWSIYAAVRTEGSQETSVVRTLKRCSSVLLVMTALQAHYRARENHGIK